MSVILPCIASLVLLAQADLNAPIVRKPPTIASEIRRGADAAEVCDMDRRGPDLDGDAFTHCVQAAFDANRQRMGQDYEAFSAGLWYGARALLRIRAEIAESRMARLNLDIAEAAFREAATPLRVTESQVCHAAYPKAQPGVCP